MQQEKHNEALAVRAEQLAREYNWQPQGRGWRLLLEKGRQRSAADLQLTRAEESLPLFRFDGGEVQVANLLYALKTNKVNSALADSAAGSRCYPREVFAAARPLLLARKEERCVGARSRSTSVHSNNSLCSEIGRLANPPS